MLRKWDLDLVTDSAGDRTVALNRSLTRKLFDVSGGMIVNSPLSLTYILPLT